MANYTVQLRRGTTAEHSSFTGAAGEITVNTSNNSIHVHDGSTAAGTAVAKFTATGLIPMVNSNGSTGFDLGASNAQWKDLYVSQGSLYVNGKNVLHDDSGTITVTTTSDQDLKVKTAGSGQLKLETADGGAVLLNGNVQLNSLNKVTSHWTVGNVKTDGSSITNVATDENLNLVTTGSGVINFADNVTAAGSMTITGDLTVNGTTTSVNSTTLTVNDPLIILQKNASGSNANDLGIVLERGADTNKAMIWDESADTFAFIDTGEDGTTVGNTSITSYADLRVNTLTGTATAAQYADLAERYHAGSPIEAGTVVLVGGENEIEASNEDASTRVAGIISTAPAFMMNKDAGSDDAYPYVALAGRVPCKVTGEIRKGDMLVSAANGHAKASAFVGGAMIGKALEDFNGESGTIEIAVNLM